MSIRLLRWLWFAFGLLLCAGFLYACLMHKPPSISSIPNFDKVEHFGAFVVMGFWFGLPFPRWPWHVLVLLSGYAAVTELLQWASGYRTGDPLDWVADTIGIIAGLAVAHCVARYGQSWLRLHA